MAELQVTFGAAARDSFCRAFGGAQYSIEAELYRLDDPEIERSLKEVLATKPWVRVCLHVEGFPKRYEAKARCAGDAGKFADLGNRSTSAAAQRLMHEFPGAFFEVDDDPKTLVHGKAAVIDGVETLVACANLDRSGFDSPGQVCVDEVSPIDATAALRAIHGSTASDRVGSLAEAGHVVSGPDTATRARIDALLRSPNDLRIAMEDLSDPKVVDELIERNGLPRRHDRILVGSDYNNSRWAAHEFERLRQAHVAVRVVEPGYFHEKYIDSGDEIYVGSHNLTRNGLDAAREIGIIAAASEYGSGAPALRADFDRRWDALRSDGEKTP
ncbi:MAG: hypothetical protein GIW99_01280 [Candidatus Eremiobacteraeota bacterium]|nr:hypothetical protein [Candidatus Eremiobacteraeota bacterium]MBC5826319.1 hypothetical protein [Candidatus Eremiobacteraeota bacterium]